MKAILFVALLGLAAVGCGGDECDDAADKYEECGFEAEGGGEASGEEAECTGVNECFAKCVNAASCDDLKSIDPENSFIKCVAGCGE